MWTMVNLMPTSLHFGRISVDCWLWDFAWSFGIGIVENRGDGDFDDSNLAVAPIDVGWIHQTLR